MLQTHKLNNKKQKKIFVYEEKNVGEIDPRCMCFLEMGEKNNK
jgi:hypothetical protein